VSRHYSKRKAVFVCACQKTNQSRFDCTHLSQ
jgi:hypothetical protein